MELGFVGLGKMGMNMVQRLLKDKHKIVVFNKTPEKINIAASKGAIPSKSLQDLAHKLNKPRIIWLMIPTGEPTENTIKQLSNYLEPNDIIIDGNEAQLIGISVDNIIETLEEVTQ